MIGMGIALLIIIVPIFLFLFAVGFGLRMIGLLVNAGLDKAIEAQQAKEAPASATAEA